MVEKLKVKTLLAYSTGGMGVNAIIVFISLYLIYFYTDIIHLDPLYAGMALGLAMLFDAASDPIMGYLSDNTKWKAGRRRPYFILGAIPSALALTLVFLPPETDGWPLFIYLTLTMAALRTFLTVFITPYYSLAPELHYDYHERTRIAAYRKFMEGVGETFGAVTPILLSFFALSLFSIQLAENTVFRLAAFFLGGLLIFSATVAFLGTKETTKVSAQYPFFAGFKLTFKNKAFMMILLTYTCILIADRMMIAEIIYVFKHFYYKSIDDVFVFLLIGFVGNACSVPLWNYLAAWQGKKVTYICALLIYPIVLAVLVWQRLPDEYLYLYSIFYGVASSGLYMMPLALIPDVIEIDQLETRQRREGAYMGIVTFVIKLGVGVSLGLLGIILWLIGYQERHDHILPASYQTTLSQQQISPPLREELKNAGIELSEQLEIIVIQEKEYWLVKDLKADKKFFFRASEEKVRVYQGQSEKAINRLRVVFALVPFVLLYLAAFLFTRFPISKQKHEEILAKIAEQNRLDQENAEKDTL